MTKDKNRFSASKHSYIGLLGLIILVGGFGGWGMFSHITGAVIAPGEIEVDQNQQVVQHLDGGIVDEILVKEGDMVTAEQLLISLDAAQLQSELSVVESQLFEHTARLGRLSAERDNTSQPTYDPLLIQAAQTNSDVTALMQGQTQLFMARRDSIAQEVSQLKKKREQIVEQIAGIQAQQTALSRQRELIETELDGQQLLLKQGMTIARQVWALQREQAQLIGQLSSLIAQRAQAESRVTEIDIEISKLRTLRREEAIEYMRDLQLRVLELAEQRRNLLLMLNRLDVRAPTAGVVHSLQVYAPRSVIRPADPILYIVPQDRPLMIAARVDPIHIDKIMLGQMVTVRLSALDQRTTPELNGRVQVISADVFVDQTLGTSFYRVEIVLEPSEYDRLPAGTVLIPGMPVETLIRTAERTPLNYLIKPLADYFTKAFREE
jgi:HlyD family secretion protein